MSAILLINYYELVLKLFDSQDFQQKELAQLATLDQMKDKRKGKTKNKKDQGLKDAMSSTEKIREWVI